MNGTMNDNNNDNNTLSKEDVAIINAAFRLYEIVILHRLYRRRGGEYQFTKGSLVTAGKALAGLRPSAPGTNPVRVVAHLTKNPEITRAAIMSAIEGASKAKQEIWESIRRIELSEDELKNLSEEATIFRMFRGVSALDRTIKELGQSHRVSKIAHLASTLADKFSKEWEERNPLPAVQANAEAA